MNTPNASQVLIVDDNPVNLQLIQRYVRSLGHETHLAADGEHALEILGRQKIDLMLLDLFMPKMNGHQVLEVMRADGRLHRVPVIIISSYDESEGVVRCIEQGADDYLVKPFKPALFKARLEACLERKQFQDRERRYQEQIEQTNRTLREREAELNASLEKEKELNRLKTRFVAMASHEFRTPLTTILAATDMLDRYSARMDEAQKKTRLERIKDEVRHMVFLLEEVLLIGKVEANKLDFKKERIDLHQLCKDKAREMMDQEGGARTLEIVEYGQHFRVMADQRHLLRIVDNLMSNAIKYSPDYSTIQLTLEQHNGRVNFSVKDQGIGIPETDQKHLFEPFHRAENVGTVPGTGLGLAIIKRIVELHGGSIDLKSRIDRGTMVRVSLQAADTSEHKQLGEEAL
ncbi:MAG: hybrid sensor histidine kinase/response regulator [Acidobacteriota bacterium]|nr:hybrid sensor histidine kinase/response regulator [Acidobacteriota bacterium]